MAAILSRGVTADVLAADKDRPSAGTMLTTKSQISFVTVNYLKIGFGDLMAAFKMAHNILQNFKAIQE